MSLKSLLVSFRVRKEGVSVMWPKYVLWPICANSDKSQEWGHNQFFSPLVPGEPTDGKSLKYMASFKVIQRIPLNLQTYLPAVNPQHCTATSSLHRKGWHKGRDGCVFLSPVPTRGSYCPHRSLSLLISLETVGVHPRTWWRTAPWMSRHGPLSFTSLYSFSKASSAQTLYQNLPDVNLASLATPAGGQFSLLQTHSGPQGLCLGPHRLPRPLHLPVLITLTNNSRS